MNTPFDITTFDVEKYDSILARGLSVGLGNRSDLVCIEAAICIVLGLPHGDDPGCVGNAIRHYKIALNDSCWSCPKTRAQGMRNLGLAQLGSKGVVDDKEFKHKMALKTINILIPKLFRHIFPKNQTCLTTAKKCEQATLDTADAAAFAAASAAAAVADASSAAYAADDASAAAFAAANAFAATAATNASSAAYAYAAYAYAAANATNAANAAANVNRDGKNPCDKFLILSANLALETLKELGSPGCALLL